MRILVTGSAGHLGEALVRTLLQLEHEVIGLDIAESPFTNCVGSVADRGCVRRCMRGVERVFHAAALHKPHIATHSKLDFISVNITGTLNLLEEAVSEGTESFIYTSSTSVFGNALSPPQQMPAAWITEETARVPKNIYGVTKSAAEDLCQIFQRKHGLACLILRTARFFPEKDDNRRVREAYSDANVKVNEFLYRRADVEDVVSAHLRAAERAAAIGFCMYIISATTPFSKNDLADLRSDAPRVVRKYIPEYEAEYARRNWKMFPSIDRVYVNERAQKELGWAPRFDFPSIIQRLRAGEDLRSPLALLIGSKGYHPEAFHEGPYPVE
jgi:UDP-glucose 4-epimerase